MSGDASYDSHRHSRVAHEDVKSRLVRAFVRSASPQRPITRMLTGHKGSGKTTELNRVASALHSDAGGKKVFVSTLDAQRWLDVEDVQPEDLVLQIVRQLVADLQAAGMNLGAQRCGPGKMSTRRYVRWPSTGKIS